MSVKRVLVIAGSDSSGGACVHQPPMGSRWDSPVPSLINHQLESIRS